MVFFCNTAPAVVLVTLDAAVSFCAIWKGLAIGSVGLVNTTSSVVVLLMLLDVGVIVFGCSVVEFGSRRTAVVVALDVMVVVTGAVVVLFSQKFGLVPL